MLLIEYPVSDWISCQQTCAMYQINAFMYIVFILILHLKQQQQQKKKKYVHQ